ncbi:MAG TPA: calcium-binding protein [Bauldia sp.]|nr:calcium-binding protein [Bauldia sp.]
MAEIKLLVGGPVDYFPFDYINVALDTGTATASVTEIIVLASNGVKVVFYGTFTVDGGGDVTAGTMTGYDVFAGSTKVVKATGYSTSGAALFDAIQGFSVDDDPFYDLILNVPLKVIGSPKDDIELDGGEFNDKLLGNNGNDILFAFNGDDNLKGGKGNDLLIGADGFDKLKGGLGDDVFGFFIDGLLVPLTYDKVKDFTPGEDLIGLEFSMLPNAPPPGYLDKQYFHQGTQATTADQIVIYDKKNGNINIDVDGTGSQAQYLLATVKPGTKLTADDFYVQLDFFA